MFVFNRSSEHQFASEMAELMIPDVCQYVSNISFCLLQANENKKIYRDVVDQWLLARKKNNVMYSSFDYKVGTLLVDGRAFANRIFRDWCSCINKIRDSICHIVNIVYECNVEDKSVCYKTTVKKVEDEKLKSLWDSLNELITVEFTTDNHSKHRINTSLIEKLSRRSFEELELLNNCKESVSDILCDEREKMIHDSIKTVLDYLFFIAKGKKHSNRAYVEIQYDPEIPLLTGVELSNDFDKNKVNTICVRAKCESEEDGRLVVKNVEMDVFPGMPETLYLASLYYCDLQCCKIIKFAKYSCERIDVVEKGRIIGHYEMKNNDDVGFQFGRYEYVNDLHG